jgi:uncharacterized protein (DUF486 family)
MCEAKEIFYINKFYHNNTTILMYTTSSYDTFWPSTMANIRSMGIKIFIYGSAVITNTMGHHTNSHPTPNASPPKKKIVIHMFQTFSRSYYNEKLIFVPLQTLHNYVL